MSEGVNFWHVGRRGFVQGRPCKIKPKGQGIFIFFYFFLVKLKEAGE